MISPAALLDKLKADGLISPLDYHLSLFLGRQASLPDGLAAARFALLVAWLSMEVRAGHVCINLDQVTAANLAYRLGREAVDHLYIELAEPTLPDWIALCQLVGPQMVSTGNSLAPMVLNANRLYFQRMWQYEQQVADYFFNRTLVDYQYSTLAEQWLHQLFPATDHAHEVDWQQIATASAITAPVAIISGGPGTGKTTTISKILAILVALAQQYASPPLRIVAAAPTGKAAARLTESLAAAVATLPISTTIKHQIPAEAITLHRLLGARIESSQYLYHQANLLNVDILLIDEASMIDLPMMASIIAALPSQAKLILLGDKEQLSSVEAGAVFGDLCELSQSGYSEQYVQMIKQLTGYQLTAQHSQPAVADGISLLHKSYRFASRSGIGMLANAIKLGDSEQAIRLLSCGQYGDLTWHTMVSNEHYQQAIAYCADQYQAYLNTIQAASADIPSILSAFARFRLLCALREGPFGVKGLNQRLEQLLVQAGSITIRKHEQWYIGRPVMILKNSFSLGLFNGDIGITLPAAEDKHKLHVYFLLANGEIKSVSPFRLPEHETAYAMTIHKSQGSEFERVAIMLPNDYSPLLTRSLLYTAITRAKQQVTIYAAKNIVEQTITSRVHRQSGLVDLILKQNSALKK